MANTPTARPTIRSSPSQSDQRSQPDNYKPVPAVSKIATMHALVTTDFMHAGTASSEQTINTTILTLCCESEDERFSNCCDAATIFTSCFSLSTRCSVDRSIHATTIINEESQQYSVTAISASQFNTDDSTLSAVSTESTFITGGLFGNCMHDYNYLMY